jgi:hypothetical protein
MCIYLRNEGNSHACECALLCDGKTMALGKGRAIINFISFIHIRGMLGNFNFKSLSLHINGDVYKNSDICQKDIY